MVEIATLAEAEAIVNNAKDRAESTGSTDFDKTTKNTYWLARRVHIYSTLIASSVTFPLYRPLVAVRPIHS